MLDKLSPLVLDFDRDSGITIPGEVNELNLVVYPIEIDYLRTARLRAGEGQPAFAYQAIQQAGFTDITSAQKRNLREAVVRKLVRPRGACNKLRFQKAKTS
jgi:hypothetical protein